MQSKARVKVGGKKEELSEKEIEMKRKNEQEKNKFQINSDNRSTQEKTLILLLEGKNIQAIAEIRDVRVETIIDHMQDLIIPKNPEIIMLQEELKITYDYKKVIEIVAKEARAFLKEFIEKNKIKEKDLQKIKEEINTEGKLKAVFNKYENEYKDLEYSYLKLIRVL